MNMESLEYIESYFEKKLSPDESRKFEQRIKMMHYSPKK
jgi:hypothetical protein